MIRGMEETPPVFQRWAETVFGLLCLFEPSELLRETDDDGNPVIRARFTFPRWPEAEIRVLPGFQLAGQLPYKRRLAHGRRRACPDRRVLEGPDHRGRVARERDDLAGSRGWPQGHPSVAGRVTGVRAMYATPRLHARSLRGKRACARWGGMMV